MVFSSLLFVFGFLPLFLSGYVALPDRYRNAWALVGSCLFYAWGGGSFIFVLLGSLMLDFSVAKRLERSMRKLWLAVGLAANLGLLVYFKYAEFGYGMLRDLGAVPGGDAPGWVQVALPIGISFFTFQKISYLVDVYRRVKGPLSRFADYALYVVLFPQLIAGPIVRYQDLADQISERTTSYDDRIVGFVRFAVGLAKKVLIANNLGAIADPIFAHDPVSGASAWTALLAYSFQIYFDFSGYSDMAIGLGRMMGFRFMENFNMPYRAQSVTEFWRRWHISLGTWMRDYLYIPLGGSKLGTGRTYVNLVVVFACSGLWHGASWNFVVWGLYHGLWLVMERLELGFRWPRIPAALRTLATFAVVTVGWVLFRVESLADAGTWIGALVCFDGALDPHAHVYAALGIAALASFWPVRRSWDHAEAAYLSRTGGRSLTWPLLAVLLVLASSAKLATSGYNPFIYFRF
jgi:alginate O-acetyltransferase complex protein AlgI